MLTSILLPSYSRPKLLATTLQRYSETCGDNPVEVVVVADDEETEDIAMEWDKKTWNNDFFTVAAYRNPSRVGALKAWNQALALSHGEILFPSGDDQKPYPGWLDLALACHADKLNGYGCVGLNDKMHGQDEREPVTMTTLLFDRHFCKDVFGGVVAIPKYKYLWVDVELNERARAVNKLVFCREAVVEHLHSANGKRPLDDLDREKQDNALYSHDEAMFLSRKAAGFPNDFGSVL